jgi:SAM-dependent methyltransferase
LIEHGRQPPSAWVTRWSALIDPQARVLDLACGQGRHARVLAARGAVVTALDRDTAALASLADLASVTTVAADVESGPWPFVDGQFDAVIVTNYLHRPLFAQILSSICDGGVLIYETFMSGNERYGRPSNPQFLLRQGELLAVTDDVFQVVAFEQGLHEGPNPAVMQRICAIKGKGAIARLT